MLKLAKILVMLLLTTSAAHALTTLPPWLSNPHGNPSSPPTAVSAPEISAVGAVSALTLLVGGLAVLRGRRTKK